MRQGKTKKHERKRLIEVAVRVVEKVARRVRKILRLAYGGDKYRFNIILNF